MNEGDPGRKIDYSECRMDTFGVGFCNSMNRGEGGCYAVSFAENQTGTISGRFFSLDFKIKFIERLILQYEDMGCLEVDVLREMKAKLLAESES